MELVTRVELAVSCRDLLNTDLTSKSDPICVVEYFKDATERWSEFARTERVTNNLNPDFSKKICFDYYFETVQKLRFRIYDIDNSSSTLGDDDFLGQVECNLGNIVSSKTYREPLVQKDGKKAKLGSIIIVAEEVTDHRLLSLSLKATKLDNKDFMGKSDPYLEFWKENADGTWTLAHRTEVIKNTLNPVWKPMQVAVHTICGGNTDNKIKVVCSDWDSDGSHDFIGEFYTTVSEMAKSAKPKDFLCINPKKKAKKSSYKNSGIISLISSKIERQYSFLDYIMGGMQINFTVGIDFTLSNREPHLPESLHYLNPHAPNEYAQALMAVGNVVQDYDADKLFPAFGFGAKLPPSEELMNEFPLNFNPENPYCMGISGILESYYNAVPRVELWAPTNISPIIEHVTRFAKQAQDTQTTPQNYFVLLLITDGVIDDMDRTRSAVVEASHLPMSIIIVGVGGANFSAMEKLDGDDGELKAPDGRPVARDIVQFVPFRSLQKSGQAGLARAVLAEIPKQVTSYFKQKGMIPAHAVQQESCD